MMKKLKVKKFGVPKMKKGKFKPLDMMVGDDIMSSKSSGKPGKKSVDNLTKNRADSSLEALKAMHGFNRKRVR